MDAEEKIENHQCRACYNSNKGLRQLKTLTKCAGSQKSYAQLLNEVSNINILEDFYVDQLPQLICESCSRQLKKAHGFIQQTQTVNERLTFLAGKLAAKKELNCLQEPPVDILLAGDIKSEKEEELEFSGVFEPQRFVGLGEEVEHKFSTNVESEDVLSLTKHEQANDVENSEVTENNETQIKFEENLYFSNENNNESESDHEWREENEMPHNDTKDKKQKYLKSKKVEYNADDDIAVPCSECNKIFCNSKALARHKRNTHIPEEQKCTCPLCGRRFSRSCNMYKHMRTFHGPDSVPLIRKRSTKERVFQCEKCERNYTKKSHLNVHIKEKHNNEETTEDKESLKNSENSELQIGGDESQKKGKPKKRYEVRSLCSICGSSFASRTHLVVHMRRHTGERPFKCDLCERAYPRPSELVCHRRIHTGEKPFKCKICDKAFRVWSKMSNHMRSHTDIRPYKCKQCERSFKYSKDLNIHFRIHTGERPYKCNVCGSTFTQSNTLKAHRSKLGHMDDSKPMIVENNI